MLKPFVQLTSIFFIVLALGSGCSKKETKPEEEGTTPDTSSSDANTMGDSDSGQAMGLKTVNFGYDSFLLDASAKSVLKSNAEVLKGKPSVRVQIEGHCDSRGGIQYNIALGEKRARAAEKFLIDNGVSADRITTISYGKERPIDMAESESAHAKNRRGNFVITAK